MCVCFGSFVVPRALFSLLTHTHTLPTTNPLFSHSDKSSGSTESDAEPLSLLQINTRAMTIQTSQFSGVFNKTEDVNGRSSSWINLNAYRGQTLTRYRIGITELVASVQLLVHSPDPVWDGQSFVKHTWYFPSDLSLWPTETNKLHRVDWDSHQQNATPSSAKYVKTLLICFPICYILRKCKCFLNSVHLQHFFCVCDILNALIYAKTGMEVDSRADSTHTTLYYTGCVHTRSSSHRLPTDVCKDVSADHHRHGRWQNVGHIDLHGYVESVIWAVSHLSLTLTKCYGWNNNKHENINHLVLVSSSGHQIKYCMLTINILCLQWKVCNAFIITVYY